MIYLCRVSVHYNFVVCNTVDVNFYTCNHQWRILEQKASTERTLSVADIACVKWGQYGAERVIDVRAEREEDGLV